MDNSIPLPPRPFMELVCGPDHADLEGHFKWVSERLVALLRHENGLNEGVRLLDVGCGCGRLARSLVNEPLAAYTGFDRHEGMIRWCHEEVTSRDPRFSFHYYPVKSAYDRYDGQTGRLNAADFKFPFPDKAFDTVLLSSVFTHMPLPETTQYLREARRVLTTRGRIILSVFFAKKDPFAEGRNFYYRPREFWRTVSELGLHRHGRDLVRVLVKRDLLYGEQQNWVVLRKKRFWK